jgi:hypothetical protein
MEVKSIKPPKIMHQVGGLPSNSYLPLVILGYYSCGK